ncbi:MAG: CapA family protein [Eubacteriales bacterium]|nr:CapA family protein [Eubacteriales bacterium]
MRGRTEGQRPGRRRICAAGGRQGQRFRILLPALCAAMMFAGCGAEGSGVSAPQENAAAGAGITDGAGAADSAEAVDSPETLDGGGQEEAGEEDLHPYDFTLAFAGDINLADDWNTMEYYRQQEDGIRGCIDPELIGRMQAADLTCVNVEFCLSDKGSPMDGKLYTFRADPSHVSILQELGVDLANLANNHAYDYGEEAFVDMLSILRENGIAYVGAGADSQEAQSPYYADIDGRTVAVVSATRAEKYILTPEAGEDTPGVFRCYDTQRLLEQVREADANADFVVAYIHWGTECSETLEDAQTTGAKELVQAGADVVLGAHPHCLQGMDYVDGVPVLYSLGNYWFNEKTLDTVLAELRFYGDDESSCVEVGLIPAVQEDHYTRRLTQEDEIGRWSAHMEHMSSDRVKITWTDGKGIIGEASDGD